MGISHKTTATVVSGLLWLFQLPLAQASASFDPAPDPASRKKFDQALDRAENLSLPINKVVLYREGATALIATDKPRAVVLLKRALSDIDAAETARKAGGTLDEETSQLLEFHRLPVIMLLERIDPAEACNVLAPRQSADNDMTFQRIFFERLKNPEIVREVALRKLGHGVSPAVIAAYGVLKKSSPEVAKSLGAAIILKLVTSDAEQDIEAVHSAFLLTRLLRNDIGALAPRMVIDESLLSPDLVRQLFAFIGDAFLASKDPEELILAQRPQLYLTALEVYAPDKAQDVKLLAFALPDAKSKIMTPQLPVFDANHPDPATLTPEQIIERAALRAQVDAQFRDSNTQIALLTVKANLETLAQKERDAAVFSAVDQANRAITLARAHANVLNREAFHDGEVEFYNLGEVTALIEHISGLLQNYALRYPAIAEKATQILDGQDVQAKVALGVAIREMTGLEPYLVPAEKPPARKAGPTQAAQPAKSQEVSPTQP